VKEHVDRDVTLRRHADGAHRDVAVHRLGDREAVLRLGGGLLEHAGEPQGLVHDRHELDEQRVPLLLQQVHALLSELDLRSPFE
jgi:hypothetical protein